MQTHIHIHRRTYRSSVSNSHVWETLFGGERVAGNPGWVGWETLIMRMLISSDDERNWTLCSAEDSHSHRRPLSRCLRLPSTHTHTLAKHRHSETHSHTYTNLHTGAFMVTLWKRGAFANNPPLFGENGFIENVVCFSIWVCFAAFSASFLRFALFYIFTL